MVNKISNRLTKRFGQAMSVNDTHKSDDFRLKTCTHIFRAYFSTNFDLYIIEYLRHVVMQCPRPSINALKCLILWKTSADTLELYLVITVPKHSIVWYERRPKTWIGILWIPYGRSLEYFPGGGGGALRFRGGSHPRYVFRGKGVFFKTSACQRFCKNRTLFLYPSTKYGGGGGGGWKSAHNTRNIRRVTPEVTGLPSLLPLNRQKIIKSKVKIRVPVHPMSVFC